MQLSANPIMVAYSTAFLFRTGRVPGSPKHTGQIFSFGSLAR